MFLSMQSQIISYIHWYFYIAIIKLKKVIQTVSDMYV